MTRTKPFVFAQTTEGEREGLVWSASRIWSTVREGLTVVKAEDVQHEGERLAVRLIGPGARARVVSVGRVKTIVFSDHESR